MATFYIEANGTPYGEYRADSHNGALEALARDAGYSSALEASDFLGDDFIVAMVDTDEIARSVAQATGRPVFQDSYGDGVAYHDGRSYVSWDHLASVIGNRVWEYLA